MKSMIMSSGRRLTYRTGTERGVATSVGPLLCVTAQSRSSRHEAAGGAPLVAAAGRLRIARALDEGALRWLAKAAGPRGGGRPRPGGWEKTPPQTRHPGIYPLSLHDALPIGGGGRAVANRPGSRRRSAALARESGGPWRWSPPRAGVRRWPARTHCPGCEGGQLARFGRLGAKHGRSP